MDEHHKECRLLEERKQGEQSNESENIISEGSNQSGEADYEMEE